MYDLKIEKMINKDAEVVFKSLQEGKLFMNCSADSNSIDIDFRIGGKYKINFKNHKVSNWGEFLEIIPNQKIVFTWCQTFGPDQKPDTKVTIELQALGPKTKLVLEHTGFQDQSTCDNHFQGWNGGINDLTNEIENGRIRLVRRYETPVEKLYEKVLESKKLFGEVQDFVLNQKITLDSNVTLLFAVRDENNSALEIIHDGLFTDKDIEVNRKNWDRVTTKLMEIIG
jgi:uncharacterized protein YndB with AHSA1/START domain